MLPNLNMDIITRYFPHLTEDQKSKFAALDELYRDWNSKINVISRKDIDNLYTHHVLHSLAIARYTAFKNGTNIMDVGTGGGFPGVPLAIMMPNVHFLMIDSIGKKLNVAREISKAIGLQNVEFNHARVEDEKRLFDFVVSRAVMPLQDLVKVTHKNIVKQQNNALPNGIICLKGGDLTEETKPFKKYVEIMPLTDFFEEEFFETKKLVYLPMS